ncbi:MAG: BatA domain-containing protein [Luteolibacter sp.]
MAFLAPLFLAALAAIALPVLLHLRRNRPKETLGFSSLMFLDESPPVTKTRSRLQDILLLLLRCLALALLILAFARPFFPAENDLTGMEEGAVMNFILIDTSASMQGEPSDRALKMAENLIAGFPANEWIAVAGFSDQLHTMLDPVRARELEKGARKPTALAVLTEVKVDGKSTQLDTALLAALLAAVAATGDESLLRIHLISDFQKGSAVDRLRGEIWPGTLQVIPHPVAAEVGWSNAGIRMLPLENQVQRARITNSEGSAKSDFTLMWGSPGEVIQINVPPGESAVIDEPAELPSAGKITLTGDDFSFDNEAAWFTPARPVARVWYPEQTQAADTSEAAYFLSRALQSTPDYTVEITAERPQETPSLTVASSALDLAGVLESGGNVLFTLRDVASARALGKILGVSSNEAQEAAVKGHVLFGEIDYKSAVFAPFADARYSDFSSIRIWKYRALPTELTAKGDVVARFDSGDPAWVVYPLGKGMLHVLTTTWRPADSQLALTTKFPPLLHSLLALTVNPSSVPAAQLDPAESELTPLPESELRALGLPLDPPQDLARSAEVAKAISNAEQESRQRIGWWLLIAAAGFFLAETALASRCPNPATS